MWVPDIGELLFSCSRPSYSPPNQRCRWFVVYGGYAAFDTSPPAIIVVAKADFPIVAHQKAVKAAGGTVVDREYGTDKTTNWTAVLTTIKSHVPDGIVFTGGDTQAAAFAQQAQRLGLRAKLIAGDEACTPQFIKLAGASMNSDTYCTLAGVPPSKMPQGDAFFKRYQQRFGVQVQLYAPYAYDAVMAMVGAMQAADSTDPKVYLSKLQALNLDGVTGPIQFDDKGDIRNGAITVRQFGQGDWQDRSVVR
jgi:branched-chain amino acid transport system substrate-binding protein